MAATCEKGTKGHTAFGFSGKTPGAPIRGAAWEEMGTALSQITTP